MCRLSGWGEGGVGKQAGDPEGARQAPGYQATGLRGPFPAL